MVIMSLKFLNSWEAWMAAIGGALVSTWGLLVLIPKILRIARRCYEHLAVVAEIGHTLARIEDGIGNIIATRRITMDADSHIVHFETDAHGHLIWANRLWHRLTGLSRDEARGRGWEMALAEEGRHRFLSDYQQAIDHQRAYEGRVIYVDRAGQETTVLLAYVPVRNQAGEVLSYHGLGEVRL